LLHEIKIINIYLKKLNLKRKRECRREYNGRKRERE